MIIKTFIILITITTLNTFEIPTPKIIIYPNQGFRVSIPDEPGITKFDFHGRINKEFLGNEIGDYYDSITNKTEQQWVFRNTNVKFNLNDKLHYWLYIIYDDFGYRIDDQTYQYKGIGTYRDQLSEHSFEIPTSDDGFCTPSITTMNGKSTCKGRLIFFEDFAKGLSKWKPIVEMPTDKEDNEFVSYQDNSQICYVREDKFIVRPKLLSTFPGFDEEKVETNILNLKGCTASVAVKCHRSPSATQILPPVVSCKIRTKDQFNFKYGKIEVRAKFPIGDWIFPEMLLEPSTDSYSPGYPYGQMRIGFIRSNELLTTNNETDISGNRLYGGVILTPGDLNREDYLVNKLDSKHFGNDFHVYSLIWTEQLITLEVDGIEYGHINNNFQAFAQKNNVLNKWVKENSKTPFDRECFITLGIGVGGRSDFPDNTQTGKKRIKKKWNNKDPRNEISFWFDRDNWLSTWIDKDSHMEIDYVKIWSI